MSFIHFDDPRRHVDAIRAGGLSIYDPIVPGDPHFWIPTSGLQTLLDEGLRGMSLTGLPLRTRSKVVKCRICEVLGYPVPVAFRRTQPRFPGQLLDAYIQKSNNLQVWNEELSPSRRYAIVRVSDADIVLGVRVVTGDVLARLDTTGTLTGKYQARLVLGPNDAELIAKYDTPNMLPLVAPDADLRRVGSPALPPASGELLSIEALFVRLSVLIGRRFPDAGADQERNRGAELHRLVCAALGYHEYRDDGRFPDVRHQLLEVKLQTSPTIDLGLVSPDSIHPLDVPPIKGRRIMHCDVRYGVFHAVAVGGMLEITHFLLTTGEAFFGRLPRFGGMVRNAKLQIPLPADFFGI